MKLRKSFVYLLLLLLVFMFINRPVFANVASNMKHGFLEEQKSSANPYFFTENKGQWNDEILFIGATDFGKVVFTKETILYQRATEEALMVDLLLKNSLDSEVEGRGLLSHYNNYFIGSDASKWTTHCRNFTEIRYVNIKQNTDLVYSLTSEGLRYVFIGNNEDQSKELKLKIDSIHCLLHDQKPYDEIHSNTQTSDALEYSTYFGGSRQDYAYNIAVDALANAYIVGSTYSTDLPVSGGALQKINKGQQDAFFIKLNSKGTTLEYSTYFGGSGDDSAWSIAIDKKRNVYIAGDTKSVDFPVSQGSMQKDFKGVNDAFVIKFNTNGFVLEYSTYLGGIFGDYAKAICVDESYHAYITGNTMSPDFPITQGAFQTANKADNAFIAKLDALGNMLVYSTFLGGTVQDIALGIAVDIEDNAYVTGRTMSPDFPVTPGAFQVKHKGLVDVFVAKLNFRGSALLYSSFMGGSGSDIAYDILVDSNKCAYLTGSTQSPDFPVTLKAYQTKQIGSLDGFVVKINDNGTKQLYSTYLGGSEQDIARSIAMDKKGFVYIVGETLSNNFPTTSGSYQKNKSLGHDAFVAKLSTDLKDLHYSSFLGGSYSENPWDMALDLDGKVYIVGQTNSTDFPVTAGAYQKSISGSQDFFLSKMNLIATETKDGKITMILTIGSKNAYVNQQLVVLDVAPFIDSGRTFVPFRFVGESLGAQVGYTTDANGRVATVTYQLGSTSIILYIGRKDALVNGRTVYLDVAPQILQGRTVIPLRFVTEALGCKVDWDGQKMQVTIIYPA
jgi:hypothetical protein